MKAIDQLLAFKSEFEKCLSSFIEVRGAEARKIDSKYAAFVDILSDFTMRGGKRIRPAFTYFSYLACGGKNKAEILKAARSVELLQSFLLIHDDLIDESDLRRGKPTTHRMFEKEFEKLRLTGDKVHFGWSTAIICGDLAHMFAYGGLLETKFSFERREKARILFDEIMFETAYGWYQEVLNTMNQKVDEKEILRTMEYVTARYTIAGPVRLGAVLAGASEQSLEILKEYGLKLGIAFQIQDDILGMFGDEKEVGKPVNSDMIEGKKTLLFARLLEKLERLEDKKRKIKFLRVYGKSDKLADLEWVRELMKDTEVLSEVKEAAKKYAQEAITALTKGNFKGKGKDFLVGIAEYIVQREM